MPGLRTPSHISFFAEACLNALVENDLGNKISLCGALALLHYIDYRTTHDVDAWWNESTTSEERAKVIAVLEKILEEFGVVKTRSWGDVVSVELSQENRTVFSFQIALRSVRLEPSITLPNLNVLTDGLDDLLASKMVALVERGAPRDFRDIFTACQANIVTPQRCWELWSRRQELAGSDTNITRAKLAIETHLTRIAQLRPLDRIENAEQREQAQRLRTWFSEELLHAI